MYQEYMTKIKVGEKEYELLLRLKRSGKSPDTVWGLELAMPAKAENFEMAW